MPESGVAEVLCISADEKYQVFDSDARFMGPPEVAPDVHKGSDIDSQVPLTVALQYAGGRGRPKEKQKERQKINKGFWFLFPHLFVDTAGGLMADICWMWASSALPWGTWIDQR
jgi:hypothetical protein